MVQTMTVKHRDYSAKDVEILEGIEGVQRRPELYIGYPDSTGLFNVVREPIENSSDEFLANRNKFVGVAIIGNVITVWDQAGGIPVEKHPKTKRSTLTEIFTKLHAGGKFGGKAYKESGGVHGVGVTVTNALSLYFNVWTFRQGKWWNQSFVKGNPKTEVKPCKSPRLPTGKSATKGTVIQFEPDPKYFDKSAKLNIKRLSEFLELISYVHPGLTVLLKTDKLEKTFKNERGLEALLERERKRLQCEEISKKLVINNERVSVALQWTDDSEEYILSYVNGLTTKDGGSHVKGLTNAITDAFKVFKGKREYSSEDLRAGLIAIINVKVREPRFSSQIKDHLVMNNITTEVYDVVKPLIDEFLLKNKTMVTSIIRRAEEFNKLKATFKANKRSLAKMRSKKEQTLLSSKYAASTTKDPKRRELFLVEGDSAGGCFTGETRILLADGTNLAYKDMVVRAEKGEEFIGVGYTTARQEIKFIEPRITKYTDELIEVEMEDGLVVSCTKDHPWLLESGEYKKASELKRGDKLQTVSTTAKLKDIFLEKLISKLKSFGL